MALSEQIPRRVYANDIGLSFGELFSTTCNDSPASAAIYRESLGFLLEQKAIEVFGANGGKRRVARQIKWNDQIVAPSQLPLFFP
ncbi:hypothetical protein [Methylococcus sp. ANG]|uniref:hypothetical protein n=1 Tax=Methylococcus sp. ANG TaxID=3231903 RepID=UPI003C12C76F